jgi:hypothetical protein
MFINCDCPEPLPSNSEFEDFGDGTARFTFYPDFSQSGIYVVYFAATDGDLIVTHPTLIHVLEMGNRPPILNPIGDLSVIEGDTLDVHITSTDPDSTMGAFSLEGNIPWNLVFTDSSNNSSSIHLEPFYNQSGSYIMLIIFTDIGALSDSEYVELTIIDAGNQPPVIGGIRPQSVDEGDTLSLTVSASDPDSTTPVLSADSLPANSSFIDNLDGTGTFAFSPDYNQAGVDTVLFVASDDTLADSAYVEITIRNTNLPPDFPPPSPGIVNEGDTLIIDLLATDPDGDSIIMFINCDCPEPLPPRSEFEDFGDGNARFTFYPDFSQSGIYVLYFAATDGDLIVTRPTLIHVFEMGNQPPTLNPIGNITVIEGGTLDVHITATDPDSTMGAFSLEGDIPWNLVFTDSSNNSSSIHLEPFYNQSGNYNMLIIFTDLGGLSDSEYVELTIVEAGNQHPRLDPISNRQIVEDIILEIPVRATDPDSTIPSLFIRNKPDSAAFTDYGDGTGLFWWRPSFEDIGIYLITFGCIDQTDSSLADSQIVTIEVIPSGSYPPVFDPVPDQTINTLDTLNLLILAFDPNGDSITIFYVDTLPAGMVFTDSGDGVASLYWVPTPDHGGDHLVTLIAADDSLLTDTLRINITVITFVRGDANGDGTLNGLDVVYLVGYFKGQNPPPVPPEAGDANGDGILNGLDVVYLVAYFKGTGPPPPPG